MKQNIKNGSTHGVQSVEGTEKHEDVFNLCLVIQFLEEEVE